MNRFAKCAIAATCLALAHVALADGTPAARPAAMHPNEVPPNDVPPPLVLEGSEEPRMHSPALAVGGGLVLTLGLAGTAGSIALFVAGSADHNSFLPGFGGIEVGAGCLALVGSASLIGGGSFMIGKGLSRNPNRGTALEPPSQPTIDVGLTPGGLALRGSF